MLVIQSVSVARHCPDNIRNLQGCGREVGENRSPTHDLVEQLACFVNSKTRLTSHYQEKACNHMWTLEESLGDSDAQKPNHDLQP